MVIFHSYVSLPEGSRGFSTWICKACLADCCRVRTAGVETEPDGGAAAGVITGTVGTGVALGMASMAGPLGGSSYIEMCCKGMQRV